jgi:transcription elongation factor Elf1
MPVLLEVLAAVSVAGLLLWLVYKLYRLIRPLPQPNVTLLSTKEDYFRGTNYRYECGVCGTVNSVDSKSPFPNLICSICGEGGSLRRVQAAMRSRILAAKAAAAAKVKTAERQAAEVREGGRRIDLDKK